MQSAYPCNRAIRKYETSDLNPTVAAILHLNPPAPHQRRHSLTHRRGRSSPSLAGDWIGAPPTLCPLPPSAPSLPLRPPSPAPDPEWRAAGPSSFPSMAGGRIRSGAAAGERAEACFRSPLAVAARRLQQAARHRGGGGGGSSRRRHPACPPTAASASSSLTGAEAGGARALQGLAAAAE